MALKDYPGVVPSNLVDAYRIQDEAILLLGEPVLGWKVAMIPAALRQQFGAQRLAGPVFRVSEEERGNPEMPLFVDGYAAGEAEFQLRIGHVPDGRDPTPQDVADSIETICIGIEAAGSPYAKINRHGPAATISDFGNNNGLVIGPRIERGQSGTLRPGRVTSRINGRRVGASVADPMAAFSAARFLYELARQRDMDLRAGQWISAGALTGAHEVLPGDCFAVEFEDAGTIACVFAAMACAVALND